MHEPRRVRIELRWWAVPLMWACLPFAVLAALTDWRRAFDGLVNVATLGARAYEDGRRLPPGRARERAREEIYRRLF